MTFKAGLGGLSTIGHDAGQGAVACSAQQPLDVGRDGASTARFIVSEAWPTKYEVSELNAKGSEVLVETLELSNEGIERVS